RAPQNRSGARGEATASGGGWRGLGRVGSGAPLGERLTVATAMLEALPACLGLVAHRRGGLAYALPRSGGASARAVERGGSDAGADDQDRAQRGALVLILILLLVQVFQLVLEFLERFFIPLAPAAPQLLRTRAHGMPHGSTPLFQVLQFLA